VVASLCEGVADFAVGDAVFGVNDAGHEGAYAEKLAIKAAIGKLKAPDDLEAQMAANRFLPLPITVGHAIAAGKLPRHHADPFDRMLVAQASVESLTLLTSDEQMTPYNVQIMLA